MTYLLFVLGLVALFFGGEFLVRGAVGIARHMRLSPMVIGLTVVGFGTSAPELLVSLQAAVSGQPAIAVGNVLGSNVANILFILGIAAAISTLAIPGRQAWRDLAVLLVATALLWWTLLDGVVSRGEGLLLIAGLAAFLAMALLTGEAVPIDQDLPLPSLWLSAAFAVGGIVVLVIGARLLVDSASQIARSFGVTEAVIGLTVIAVGTSLPELATSIIASLRRETDIAVGNAIGSNIFNILAILGITALVTPIPVDPRFVRADMIWVAATALIFTAVALGLRRIPRSVGFGFLLAYAVYVAVTAF